MVPQLVIGTALIINTIGGLALPLTNHPSFNRPTISVPLWRYTDLSKFVDLLTSKSIWLTNLELLAADDPYEGLPDAMQFPHRLWKTINDVPKELREQIIQFYVGGDESKADDAFRRWFMLEEQQCYSSTYGRRQLFINCWHAANHESAAMWKIYSTPGAGVAVITNGARMEEALSNNSEEVHLGAVEYQQPGTLLFGASNSFDKILMKRAQFSYEQEVRLVHWDTNDIHDPLVNFSWNDETMRFDDIVEDTRPIRPGHSLEVDIDTLIQRVVVSPAAAPWYTPMIERLKDQLGYSFPVEKSSLLDIPSSPE